MNFDNDNIKFLEYDHSFAPAVADMWAKSSDGWNGFDFNATEESVKREIENSAYLNVYLALAGNDVVGYCAVSEYREDEGALYIDLLNVRTDYHGRKIGKALVLKDVERTIELGWPRLDLYTWAGNTKATPLYKKCGFFWEDRDDVTHLMNFIPTVLNTEMLKDFFTDIDWYNDSTRPIEVVPDGRRENGFDYFSYEWTKNNKHILVEFCRRGRGLRKIETDEYEITATVEKLDLVFGKKYNVSYEIKNKTEKSLDVSIKGINDKNITFSFKKDVVVKDSMCITGRFSVGKIEQEQSIWKTHPGVTAEVKVNGKKARFKIGIVPKYPAAISLKNPKEICYTGVESELYLDIDNNFDHNTTFSFELPSHDDINLLKRKFSIPMKPKEKKSLVLPYILNKSCVYSCDIAVTAIINDQDTIKFKRKIGAAFHTFTGIFYGQTDRYYLIGNGRYFLKLVHTEFSDEFVNRVIVGDITRLSSVWILPPKTGKPFSDEFFKQRFNRVTFYREDNSVVLNVQYVSVDFKGIEFSISYRLYLNGIIEYWYEVQNSGKSETPADIWIGNNLHFGDNRTVMPYNGKFIEMRDEIENKLSFWEPSNFSEQWIFRRSIDKMHTTFGICWPDGHETSFPWAMFLACNMKKIKPGVITKSEPVIMTIDTFRDWHRFREFALKRNSQRGILTESTQFLVNRRNPFVKDRFPVSIIEHKQKYLDGEIIVSSENDFFDTVSAQFEMEQKNKKCDFEIKLHSEKENTPFDIARMKAIFRGYSFQRQRAVFPIGENKITAEKKVLKDHKVLLLDNGVISLKVAPSFAPTVFSCVHNNTEWMDSSFPEKCSRSWWNPWAGGLYSFPGPMALRSVFDEECAAEFVEREDIFGNEWSGLCLEISIEKNKRFRGLTWKQYYLLLPGVPVVLYITELIQNTGEFVDDLVFKTDCFLIPDEQIKNCYWKFKNKEGQLSRMHAGTEQMEGRPTSSFILERKSIKDTLQFYSDRSKTLPGIGVNKEVIYAWWEDKINCIDGKRIFLPPKFLIFADSTFDDEWLDDLKDIRFKYE
jgi:GNAT superfamily N-acetyltransferase